MYIHEFKVKSRVMHDLVIFQDSKYMPIYNIALYTLSLRTCMLPYILFSPCFGGKVDLALHIVFILPEIITVPTIMSHLTHDTN